MAETEPNSPTFAFMALREFKQPSLSELETALRISLPEGTSITNIEIDASRNISFFINGEMTMVGLLDFPIPWGDLEIPCARSWLWRDATQAMKSQKCHLIVLFCGSNGTKVERCIVLTRILAAVTRCLSTIGLYWGHGSVVLSPELLQEQADKADTDNLPLVVWIEFCIQKNADKTTNVLTSGLEYFGCMELEVIRSPSDLSSIMNGIMGVATITLLGDVFKDGDTFGPDTETRIKTHHAKSYWDRPNKILKLEI